MGTHSWSGKPLPKDATNLEFVLVDGQHNKPKIKASIPKFTNIKGKDIIIYDAGWNKMMENKIS